MWYTGFTGVCTFLSILGRLVFQVVEHFLYGKNLLGSCESESHVAGVKPRNVLMSRQMPEQRSPSTR